MPFYTIWLRLCRTIALYWLALRETGVQIFPMKLFISTFPATLAAASSRLNPGSSCSSMVVLLSVKYL